jgi:hypothetical protein
MATKKVGRAQALNAFLKSPRTKVKRCETCNGPEDIRAAIVAFVKARNAGATNQSLAAFHRFLGEVYGYKPGETALYSHVENCVKGGSKRRGK